MTNYQATLFGILAVIAALVIAYTFHLRHSVKQKALDCRIAANKSLALFIVFVIMFIALHYALSVHEKNFMPGYVYITTFIMISIGLISYIYLFSIHYQNSNDEVLEKLSEIQSLLNELNSRTDAPSGPDGGSSSGSITHLNSQSTRART